MRESKVERAILVDLLVFGDDKAANIGHRTGRPASSISRSLTTLADENLIENKGTGVYRLTEKGRSEAQTLVMGLVRTYDSTR